MNMGIGKLGEGFVLTNRKYRWLVEAKSPDQTETWLEKTFIKPKSSIGEDFIEKTATFTCYGVQNNSNFTQWLARCFHEGEFVGVKQSLIIGMYSGCGEYLEEWRLFDASVIEINYGFLDFNSSEELDITVKVKYERLEYESKLPTTPHLENL